MERYKNLNYLTNVLRVVSKCNIFQSCTDVLATWIQPPTKKIKFDQVQNIKFKVTEHTLGPTLSPFNDTEINELLDTVQACGKTSAIMTVRLPYSKKFEPVYIHIEENAMEETQSLSQLYLQSLYRHELRTASLDELLAIAKDIQLYYSYENINLIENLTKSQSKSKFWY